MEFFRAYLTARLSQGTKFSPVLYGTKPLLGFAIGPTILGGRSDRHVMRTTCSNLNSNAPSVGVAHSCASTRGRLRERGSAMLSARHRFGSDCLPAVRPICEILETSALVEGDAPLWTDSLSSDGVRA
jgi:hypothetical protein